MNIFLDLEETLIDEFHDSPVVKTQHCVAIRNFIDTLNTSQDKFFLFSFAIYDDKDILRFNTILRRYLENLLDCKFDRIITVPEMMKSTNKVNKPRLRFNDISDFILDHGKECSFHDWCHDNHVGQASVLIDDVVHNRITVDDDTKTIIKTVNVMGLL